MELVLIQGKAYRILDLDLRDSWHGRLEERTAGAEGHHLLNAVVLDMVDARIGDPGAAGSEEDEDSPSAMSRLRSRTRRRAAEQRQLAIILLSC